MSQRSTTPRVVHMDRAITFGFIFTLLVQSAGVLIWVGSAAARLSALETDLATHSAIAERLARLEGQTSEMTKSLSRIERELIHSD